ncbi:MAG: hypothetical protein J1E96_02015 [Ruminococcus sp.]|nr:hypothetical protein [Ruminococcus sp.]
MNSKKCPYCGRRISYFTIFHEKKHGLYTCTRCRKESKIKTDFRLIVAFIAMCLAVVIFMLLWFNSKNYNNFAGVVIIAIALIIFYFLTPLFVRFVPLKKYRKNTEEQTIDSVDNENFHFNRAAFEKVKQNRAAKRPESDESRADKVVEQIESEPYVPIIRDVSSSHASSDAPLRRVQKTPPKTETEPAAQEEDVRTYVPKTSRPDGSKYTANRKF